MRVRLDNAASIVGARRVDRAARLSEPERTDEGYLVAECVVAKPGVLFYRDVTGGYFRELVTEDTLRASAASLVNKPVTLEHPSEFVNPDNIGDYGQGVVLSTRIDDEGKLIARIVVQKREALDALEGGLRELSPGYKVNVDHHPGTDPDHGDYDGIQSSRSYNHLALTERARGGPEIIIRVDAVEVDPSTAGTAGNTTEVPMRPLIAALMTLSVSKEAAEAHHDSIVAIVKDTVRNDHADEVKTAKAEAVTATERADAAEKALAEATTLETRLDWFGQRTKLEELAKTHKIEDTVKLDNAELAREILKAAKVDVDGKSDDWVSARIDFQADQPRVDSKRGEAFRRAAGGKGNGVRIDADEPKRPVTRPNHLARYHQPTAK